MEDKNLAEELQKPNVDTFDTTELAIIAAIKNGFNTLTKINEETAIKENYAKNILDSLIQRGYILQIPGSDEDSYMLKLQEKHESKKLRLPGSLILPVSTFRDAEGQRWVTRGKWHKIDDDVDIMNDIEWYEDTAADDIKMKTVMKMVSEQKRKTASKKIENQFKNSGDAPEEIKNLMTGWTPLTENIKLNVAKASSEMSLVYISPRYISKNGVEFPFGTSYQMTLENEKILEMVNNKTFNKKLDIADIIQNFKKIIVFKSEDNGMLIYADILDKKKNIVIMEKMIDMNNTNSCKNLGTKNVTIEELKNIIETQYPLFMEIINRHNETVTE